MDTHSWMQQPLVAVFATGLIIGTNHAAFESDAAHAAIEHTAAAAAVEAASLEQRRGEREVTIPAGTRLRLQLDNSVASDTSRVEDEVRAHLAAPVVVDGRTVLPARTPATGHVTVARPSGKVKGRAYVAVRFTEVRADDERYRMSTRAWGREAPGTKKKDAAKIAVPGAVGAVVGAAIDGKKGAAIGGAVGAGAGTGVVLATSGPEVRLPRGSTLIVRLSAPLVVRVPA
jgi:hypothetical protein